jgi:protein-S-isoprenylcysteine O-methyltransferase Ste14
MDYLLALLQGLGIAAAIGIRPFLPTLLVGALAAGDIGLDYDGTDFAFLEQTGFLLAIVIAVAVFGIIDRRRHADTTGQGAVVTLLLVCALVLAALSASGSIADVSSDWWPGIPIGVAAASLGFLAARSLFGRVSARLDDEAAKALPLYAEGIALIAAGFSVLFPPLAIIVVGALAWLLIGGRRRAGEKYAGLRILR